eukprot:CAMPEP_0170205848 /NCGR_PEP_ID=MMETSP0116_2-20130129/2470_1 /TAXON_ID=400756 /ORGANISM="Durinskia baltica, Strain CSIRO CS-38" /LENGTH=47 /DNA_ID= /DNA_START= /DNA_END= /DNA_ORIENTATION=
MAHPTPAITMPTKLPSNGSGLGTRTSMLSLQTNMASMTVKDLPKGTL